MKFVHIVLLGCLALAPHGVAQHPDQDPKQPAAGGQQDFLQAGVQMAQKAQELAQAGRTDAAKAVAQQAAMLLNQYAGAKAYQNFQSPPEANAAFEDASAEYVDVARQLAQVGRFEEAREVYEQAIAAQQELSNQAVVNLVAANQAAAIANEIDPEFIAMQNLSSAEILRQRAALALAHTDLANEQARHDVLDHAISSYLGAVEANEAQTALAEVQRAKSAQAALETTLVEAADAADRAAAEVEIAKDSEAALLDVLAQLRAEVQAMRQEVEDLRARIRKDR